MKVSVIGLRGFPYEFPGTSGIEYYVDKLVHEFLKDKNIEVVLFCRKKYQRLVKKMSNNSRVKIIQIATPSHFLLETFLYSFIASVISSIDPKIDVVWYQGVGPACWAWIPRVFGKKTVLTVHSLDWKRKKWSKIQQRVFRVLAQLSFLSAQVVTSVSSRIIKELQYEIKRKIIFSPSGIDSPKKAVKKSKSKIKVLLFIGRIVPEKRLEWLLHAFSLLEKRVPKLCLVILGGDSHSKKYVSILKSVFNSKKIYWPGYQFGKIKQQLLNNSDELIIPSELEGLPIVALERVGMAQHLIVSENCIDPELLSIPYIHVFEARSFYSFVTEVTKSILRKKSQVRLSRDQIHILAQFSWEKTAAVLYQQFIDR